MSLFPPQIGEHPFGQDEVGRDIFAVVMRGAQQSLMVMVIAGVVATIIGVVIGAIAGYYRKATDSVLMRFTDIIITIPLIVIGAVLGQHVRQPRRRRARRRDRHLRVDDDGAPRAR